MPASVAMSEVVTQPQRAQVKSCCRHPLLTLLGAPTLGIARAAGGGRSRPGAMAAHAGTDGPCAPPASLPLVSVMVVAVVRAIEVTVTVTRSNGGVTLREIGIATVPVVVAVVGLVAAVVTPVVLTGKAVGTSRRTDKGRPARAVPGGAVGGRRAGHRRAHAPPRAGGAPASCGSAG